jgi:hypothetical protein
MTAIRKTAMKIMEAMKIVVVINSIGYPLVVEKRALIP